MRVTALGNAKDGKRYGFVGTMMSRVIVLLLFLPTGFALQQNAIIGSDLTVAEHHLPTGCRLAPTPYLDDGPNRIRGNLWGNLPLPENPYVGSDPILMMLVRGRLEPSKRRHDTSATKEEIINRATEGIDEVYAAYYMAGRESLVEVLALKRQGPNSRTVTGKNDMRIGPFEVTHSGDGGECHQAVVRHLRSLAQ